MSVSRARWRVLVSLLLVGAVIGGAWIWLRNSAPRIEFAGFRSAGSVENAVFRVMNPTGSDVQFVVGSAVQPVCHYRIESDNGWVYFDERGCISTPPPQILRAGESMEVQLAGPPQPFQIGIRFQPVNRESAPRGVMADLARWAHSLMEDDPSGKGITWSASAPARPRRVTAAAR